VFALRKPSKSRIHGYLEQARNLPLTYNMHFVTENGSAEAHIPNGYTRDHTRSEIGYGLEAFETAKTAFRAWLHFDLGWLSVAHPTAKIEPEEIVAVQAHTLGLWSLNFSRILYVIDESHRFGYGYGTTAHHVERGEERFLLEFHPESSAVFYDLLAVSQPAHWMAQLAYPYTRSQQRRFARDSHRRMRKLLI
jgi:uncharacterized protein (UPF0548 family)